MDEQKIIEVYSNGVGDVISLIKNMNNALTGEITRLNTHITGLDTHIVSLNNQLTDLNGENQKLSVQISELSARTAELEARLNKNSNTSSKPPSSDGYKKPTVTNSRKKSEKKTGGQFGHKGVTLNKVDTPNEIIDIPMRDTCDCGCALNDVAGAAKTRQVFDIPEIIINVTEYRVQEKVCPICGKSHKAEFPEHITQPVQYGPNMKSLMVYLKDYQFIPLQRTVEAIKDITGQKVSEGTIVNVSEQLYSSLEQVVSDIKETIKKSDVIHCDETGVRITGKTQWMHVASTETATYYEVHQKRGYEATSSIGILPEFQGTMVHDHWKPLYKYEQCTHAECNAHNIRYLLDVHKNHKQDWAEKMLSLLVELHRRVNSLKSEGFERMELNEMATWHDRYHVIIKEGIQEDDEKSPKILSKKGKPQKSTPLKLLLKLQDYDIETLSFMYDFKIPFDNNLAERDLRMQKLRQKISGCFRSEDGAKGFCLSRTYISTARKRGQTAYEAIKNIFKGKSSVPEIG